MTPEMLEKLRLAREKAAQIQRERKEIHAKTLQSAMSSQPSPQPVDVLKDTEPPPSLPDPPQKQSKKVKKTHKIAQKIQHLVEQESTDDSSGDDSDPDDIVQDFLKKKYRHKYKSKYQAKVDHALLKGSAANHIKNRVSEDMIKIAQQQIFGTY
jgi:hypothetical protein